jgi:hypothetical protein
MDQKERGKEGGFRESSICNVTGVQMKVGMARAMLVG